MVVMVVSGAHARFCHATAHADKVVLEIVDPQNDG